MSTLSKNDKSAWTITSKQSNQYRVLPVYPVLRNNPSTPETTSTTVNSNQNRSLMTTQPIAEKPRSQPSRLVFRGLFQLWAKPRLPPDVASVASGPINPTNSGCEPLVVADGAAAPGRAADLAGLEPRDGLLRRWPNLGFQGDIALSLVRALDVVVVPGVLVQDLTQAAVAQEPALANALSFYCAYPALGEGIEVGAMWRDADCLDALCLQAALPPLAEVAAPVVDEVLGSDLLQPAVLVGRVAHRLDHELLVGVIGHPEDLDLARGQVDGEQDIVGRGAEQSGDIHGEEVGRHQLVHLLGDEGLPGRVGRPLGSRLETMAIQDRRDGAGSEIDVQLQQLAANPLLTPGRVLLGHPDDRFLDLLVGLGPARPRAGDAQLALLQQPEPAADGRPLGDGGDLGQPLPAHAASGPGQPLAPGIREPEGLVLGKLRLEEGDLDALVGQLGDQGLVLPGEDGSRDEPDQEGHAVHKTVEGLENSVANNKNSLAMGQNDLIQAYVTRCCLAIIYDKAA
jgi:hypothetical protein